MTSSTEDLPLPRDGALFFGSDIYRNSTYGRQHPLAIPRVSTVIDLARVLGFLPDAAYRDSPRAGAGELARFHRPDYIAAVAEAERTGAIDPERGRRYQLGCCGNPIYAEMFRRPATACGASLLAAERLAAAPGLIYSPGGGTHHGRPDRASGFCYFNDPVLAILRLLDRGVARVLYVDLDAHHGDGVQDALAAEEGVMTLSVHEAGRWPFTGAAEDRGGGNARNFPVPAGFNDDELDVVVEEALLPLGQGFAPNAVVLQCGADGLDEDPLSRLGLSNGALWRAAGRLARLADRVLVLGGGGYNPWSVARCWTGLWATLTGQSIPERLPPDATGLLRALSWSRSAGRNPPSHWFETLADPPRPGPVRPEIRRLVAMALAPPPDRPRSGLERASRSLYIPAP